MERFTTDDLFKASYLRLIEEKVREFEDKVFIPVLQNSIDKSTVRGHTTKCGKYVIRTFETAARVLITIAQPTFAKTDDYQISLIGPDMDNWMTQEKIDSADEEHSYRKYFKPTHLGIQSIDGEYTDIRDMLDYVSRNFSLDEMKADKKVSVFPFGG